MCYQVIERYAVCRCLYHQHAVDRCPMYGQRSHAIVEKTVLVGYTCPAHSTSAAASPSLTYTYPDLGYHSEPIR
ncbi:hypothetical protein EJ08DRAFT_589528 [Tothia fuscella]|uniref:Uncharacterized protein n=1 Tax=Tothia fuscella TaxID=1048955 RepID=A0A9P4TYS6_9PEZI|nr:hypothetical protein EJ08DRAFT_589528 [Tothia fuscella]